MPARVYFMKTVNGYKDVSIMINREDGQFYSVCILQFSCFTKYAVKTYINKQNVNKADETLTDYSYLSRYHLLNQ